MNVCVCVRGGEGVDWTRIAKGTVGLCGYNTQLCG